MMGLVDDHDVRQLRDPFEASREVATATEIGVREDGEVAEVPGRPADVWYVLAQMGLPYRFPRGLRRKQHDVLAFMHYEALDKHQSDEGLAQADAIAEECATVLAGDLHQRPVTLLLIAV